MHDDNIVLYKYVGGTLCRFQRYITERAVTLETFRNLNVTSLNVLFLQKQRTDHADYNVIFHHKQGDADRENDPSNDLSEGRNQGFDQQKLSV